LKKKAPSEYESPGGGPDLKMVDHVFKIVRVGANLAAVQVTIKSAKVILGSFKFQKSQTVERAKDLGFHIGLQKGC
jgi:hypothetical protein